MSAALLQVRALEKIFGGFAAVAGVDLTVAESTIHSVIGPNGAGKTTFFRLLTGVQRPHRGSVVFAGADITGSRPHAIARAGLVQSFQITNVFPRLTVLESIQTAILARQRHSGQLLTFRHRRVAREARELLGQVGL
ncbi:MAG: ATP-binding cassette domain-containing protein, partial [Sciscionella sp.]